MVARTVMRSALDRSGRTSGDLDRGALVTRRATAVVAWGALASLAVGALFPVHRGLPSPDSLAFDDTLWWWVRIVLTTCGVLCALYAPGLVLRSRLPRGSPWRNSAFVWVPGFLYLAACGLLAWGLAAYVDVATLVAVLSLPMPLLLLVALRRRTRTWVVLTRGERAVAVMMLLLLVIGIGKATWSQVPTDGLFEGTVSKTLEVGNRSDSRVPYHSVQLVAHATSPYSTLGQSYYSPWLFSDRSPMAGLATVAAVFTSGTHPPVVMPTQAWVPFDAQGFAAYRIAMMAFAATIVFSVYGLLRSRFSQQFACAAVVLVALSPFVVHEVYFTWPKLLSASFAFVAVLLLLMQRPLLSGFAMGLSYLAHPAGVFVVLTLLLGWLVLKWRERDGASPTPLPSRWRREWLRDTGVLLVGFVVVFLAWRFANQGHPSNRFVDYVTEADGTTATSVSSWIHTRMASLANTFVPLRLLLVDSRNWSIISSSGPAPVVQFGFLYWATVPFGVGLLFFPLYLFGLWRFARHQMLLFTAVLLVPLVVFWLYWGDTITGLLREGLQFWFIASVVLACFGYVMYSGRGVQNAVRWIATARVASVLVMLLVPTIGGSGVFGDDRFDLSNVLALALMVAGVVGLGVASFRLLDPSRLEQAITHESLVTASTT
jgi:hypothetical protein